MSEYYLWIKAGHLIAVISWMAGMLYLPRLFVYHCAAEKGSAQSETFKVMERRLLKAIMTPAMVATWVLGLTLAFTPGIVSWSTDGWMYVKLVLVVAMSAIHGLLAKSAREFAEDRNRRSAKFYRIINEVPAVVMVGIVLLVIVKPF
jgi:putative membrane protein